MNIELLTCAFVFLGMVLLFIGTSLLHRGLKKALYLLADQNDALEDEINRMKELFYLWLKKEVYESPPEKPSSIRSQSAKEMWKKRRQKQLEKKEES